jgi:4-carboxymuconolactone decarboxylase
MTVIGCAVINKGGDERVRLKEPRIAPLPESEWTAEQRKIIEFRMTTRDGNIPNLYPTLVRNPKMAERFFTFAGYILRDSTLPPREREILILRTGWLCQSAYEFGQHTLLGKAVGLTDEEILRITKGADAPGWDPFDATLIRAADELHSDAFISDATWNALAKRYNENQLMDLVLTVGDYNMISMYLNTMGVQLETGRPGFPIGCATLNRGGDKRKRLKQPRITPLPESEWTAEQQKILETRRKPDGSVLNLYPTLARNPKMAERLLTYASYVFRESTLPPREREIVVLRIGWLCQAVYEFGQHTLVGKTAGLTDEEILCITEGANAPGWDPFDSTLIRAADELHSDAFITDATWNALAKRYNEDQLMDLVLTIGYYNMISMYLNTMGIQLEKDKPGFPKGKN